MGSGSCAQGAAPAQNMTYGAVGASPNPVSSPPVTYGAPPMAPPSGSGTFGEGVAMGSGTFAQVAASVPNMTYEALSAAPSPVSSPVTYAAPPSPPAPDTVIGNGNVTETGAKIVAVATPPFTFATALPSSPRVSKSAESDEFKTQVVDAVNHGEDMISIPTKMAVGLLEKGLEPYPSEKPLKITKARRTGGCC